MGDLPATLEQWFPALFAGGLGWVLLWFGISFAYRKYKNKSILAERPANAAFLETWTSGHSNRNLLTKIGGARNCLLVAVTRQSLIVRPHFPFSLLFLPEIYDLDYVIPRTSIRLVTPKKGLFGETVEVIFDSSSGDSRSIELRLRQSRQFLQAVHPV
jgi:hypothetical protein